jgi:hypothetical protein
MSAGRKTGGRRKGTSNKATKTAKEAIALFIDGNVKSLQGWLDQIAVTEGPKAAFLCFTDLLEFHVPKLARTEHAGADGGQLQVTIHAEPLDESL